MRQRKIVQVIEMVGLLFIFAVTGCSSHATDYRKQGFDMMQRGFASIEKTTDLYEVIELKNVKVFIAGDRKHFNYDKATAYGSPIAGYANTRNEICLLGKRVGDKIVVNQASLGHKLNYLLNFKNARIANPDKLDGMGL